MVQKGRKIHLPTHLDKNSLNQESKRKSQIVKVEKQKQIDDLFKIFEKLASLNLLISH
jgi:hypothetical protein